MKPDTTYEAERVTWIEAHGSRRLKLAAERGYKHNGIYRDERLAMELPGYVRLPKATVKEVVNPTAEALDVESEALEMGLEARIVWIADSGSDLPDGEYVQVTHLDKPVYRCIEDEADVDRRERWELKADTAAEHESMWG